MTGGQDLCCWGQDLIVIAVQLGETLLDQLRSPAHSGPVGQELQRRECYGIGHRPFLGIDIDIGIFEIVKPLQKGAPVVG